MAQSSHIASLEQHKRVNPIEQYIANQEGNTSKFSELFKGNDDFIDQMSELTDDNIRQILTLSMNDKYLSEHGIKPIFDYYTHKFMRLMVSKDRKSRSEYVDVHKGEIINPNAPMQKPL